MASVVQQKYSYIKLQRKSLNRHNTVRQYLNCSQVYLSWLSVSVVWKVSSLSGIVTVSLNIQAFSSPIQTHLQCEVAELCLERISPTRQTGKPHTTLPDLLSSEQFSMWWCETLSVTHLTSHGSSSEYVFQNRSTHTFHVYFNRKILAKQYRKVE